MRMRRNTGVATIALAVLALVGCGAEDYRDTDREFVSFTDSNNVTSQYHVYAAAVSKPAGLLIWAHGDGAWEFHHPDDTYVFAGTEGVRAVGRSAGYIVVSVLTPDTMGALTWWENGQRNADYLADLLVELTTEYDIDSSNIVLAGFSGGAQFITQYFLPEHSSLLDGGGSIVFGGGGAPVTEPGGWEPHFVENFFMHWATGEFDDAEHSDEGYDALAYAREGYKHYSELGFSTSHYWIPDHDHEIDGLFGPIIAEQLTQNR